MNNAPSCSPMRGAAFDSWSGHFAPRTGSTYCLTRTSNTEIRKRIQRRHQARAPPWSSSTGYFRGRQRRPIINSQNEPQGSVGSPATEWSMPP
jgi:hypothetical protein